MGIGLEALAFAVMIAAAKSAEAGVLISPLWLTASYFIQTCGELCLSPIGLSMVTKLAPARFAAMLMGVWFLANAFANKLAGVGAGQIEAMSPTGLFTFITKTLLAAAVILLFLTPVLRRWMAGVK
jgi:POT family proton-dependent oligopeptide transporter